MTRHSEPWDYLILTATNDSQGSAYEQQVRLRWELGLLPDVRHVLVVPDPGGNRIGSGGSTIRCLLDVLQRELADRDDDPANPDAWHRVLERLRILIVHGGGDSTRLPAYGPCGKVFVPVPLPPEREGALVGTLFDRQLPTYLALPPSETGSGQIVITSGDVLLRFDPSDVQFAAAGMTGLGCLASVEQAAKHGVYCVDDAGSVRRFLQKPKPTEQIHQRAVTPEGMSILDIGVFHFDAATAVSLLRLFDVANCNGELTWTGTFAKGIEDWGLDFYREICCALGSEVTEDQHAAASHASGSRWSKTMLSRIYRGLRDVPFHVDVLAKCQFLHFGTSSQIITSGIDLLKQDQRTPTDDTCLRINTAVDDGARIDGGMAWIEGCRIGKPLGLGGRNVVVGVDIDTPLKLPRDACLDVIRGRNRAAEPVWFVRCYGIDDRFNELASQGATFCNRPVQAWLDGAGFTADQIWNHQVPQEKRSVWNARLFPAVKRSREYHDWLWMFSPENASPSQREAWAAADRYSLAEIAQRADHDAFHRRRMRLHSEVIRGSLPIRFGNQSEFSAADLACLLADESERHTWVSKVLAHAHMQSSRRVDGSGPDAFVVPRILHTLASALTCVADGPNTRVGDLLPDLAQHIARPEMVWLQQLGLCLCEETTIGDWASRAQAQSFRQIGRTIAVSGSRAQSRPMSVLRADEIVWARAPARLDLGGGWTDTPPYSLENGGAVINAAVDLNGQPPIQAYARVIPERVIRLTSIDRGTRCEVREVDELLDYHSPASEFALPKAALVLAGLSPEVATGDNAGSLECMLDDFGGGLELTTLAAIPKGSGLGASSIMGAVLLAAIHRVMGRNVTRHELFHDVLKLEQALTTGGGWQDQIGGVVEDAKVISTQPGLVPEAQIRFVPESILDPTTNGGQTLLYYTGITRLAKNILQQVVGRYLDRDRRAMATLKQLHGIVARVADAMARKDLPEFGALIDEVWRLNKELDPGSTNAEIEKMLQRIRPYAFGAKLLGAGGGGFLLVVCKSPRHASQLRSTLESEPPNHRARFFDFHVSHAGLTVTVC